jgi:hypothetical protein
MHNYIAPESDTETLNDMAIRADILVHEAHDALERMDIALTLAEVKVALVRQMVIKRHHREHDQQMS